MEAILVSGLGNITNQGLRQLCKSVYLCFLESQILSIPVVFSGKCAVKLKEIINSLNLL